MAIMTTSPKESYIKDNQIVVHKQGKVFEKTRPVTATLEHPLILDIKLLKRLDMTTFTKKGLIALSKFCGISLTKKADTKRKLNKCLKTIQYSRKQSGSESGLLSKVSTIDSGRRDYLRAKRKPAKQMSKTKPRIRFKITDEISGPEEDSSDVVCKRHDKVKNSVTKELGLKKENHHQTGRKTIIDDLYKSSIENIIPEPCKTCNRSEHPERFHSHPKIPLKMSGKETGKQTEKANLEDRFRTSLTTRDAEEKKSPSAKTTSQKSLTREEEGDKTSTSNKPPRNTESPNKSTSSLDLHSSPETVKSKKLKSNKKPATIPPESKSVTDIQSLKKVNARNSTNQKGEERDSPNLSVEDAMRFVTGCYVCGKQIVPKLRIKHEESCILEWRTQNNLLPPDKRRPEPKRPDYRFTTSGDLDPEGTFESIWANHKDSLVPCKKCGRRFFPDRIEKHETCCNNLPVSFKYKH